MANEINNITNWVKLYFEGYEKFILKYHFNLYSKFYINIYPPQKIGDRIGIMQGNILSDKDQAEIMKINNEFCGKCENPIDFTRSFNSILMSFFISAT